MVPPASQYFIDCRCPFKGFRADGEGNLGLRVIPNDLLSEKYSPLGAGRYRVFVPNRCGNFQFKQRGRGAASGPFVRVFVIVGLAV